MNQSSNHPYISGWIESKDKHSAFEGRFEASCKYYVGAEGLSQGLWPAIWLMPETNTTCWPVAGEIDISEFDHAHFRSACKSLGNCRPPRLRAALGMWDWNAGALSPPPVASM